MTEPSAELRDLVSTFHGYVHGSLDCFLDPVVTIETEKIAHVLAEFIAAREQAIEQKWRDFIAGVLV